MEINDTLVTVVVPCYNNGTTISETIESVLSQSINNWELICVDDGSTDNTCKIINEYCERDGRIKLIIRELPPKGGSHCRNIGAFSASGLYLVFLDGDDLLNERCLENRIQKIESTDYEFAVFPMSTFSNNLEKTKKISRADVKDYEYYYLSGSAIWQVTSPIYKKEFFIKIGGFDQRFMRFQDVEFGLRASAVASGNFGDFLNGEPDCYYRLPVSGPTLATNKLIKALESYGYMLDNIRKLRCDGYLQNNYKFSLGVLSTYLNILHLIDMVRLRGDEVGDFEEYNIVDLRNNLLVIHRLILNIMLMKIWPTPLHKRIVHLLDQYCRFHFIRF